MFTCYDIKVATSLNILLSTCLVSEVIVTKMFSKEIKFLQTSKKSSS